MTPPIRFFGVAAYEIITSKGQHILIDPFLDENPGSSIKSDQLEKVDLIVQMTAISNQVMSYIPDTGNQYRYYP
ncbi:MAG: hypothetical protein U0350_38900 [Caldilineaceae bacterium]